MRQRIGVTAVLAFLASLGVGGRAGAQGSVRVTPMLARFEVPIGRPTNAPWRWNDAATPNGQAEYRWHVVIEGDTTHTLGFMLFKFQGATPREGTFSELLRAGQSNLALLIGHAERVVRGVRPTLQGAAVHAQVR